MKIFVRVKAGAKKEGIERIGENRFSISVKEPPQEGRANWAVARGLAEYFDVPPSSVSIVSGHKSRDKVFEMLYNAGKGSKQ